MKKIFIAIVALAAATACSNSEIVSVNREAIGFDNAFVNNSVRSVVDPSYSNTKLFSDFAVYGFVEGAVLFDGTTVSKTITNSELESEWKYAGTQYWIAGANYNFHAVAPKTDGDWTTTEKAATGLKLNYTNDGTTDVLYATVAQQGQLSDNAQVAFTFRHILSKVKFSFENAYNATNATIKVKNIKIENAYLTGTVELDTDTTAWDDHAGTLVLNFGMATDAEATDAKENEEVAYDYTKVYESQNELFLIPGAMPTDGYKVTFDVDLLVGGTSVKVFKHTVYAKFTPAVGNAYDIKAVINAENIDPDHAQEPIEFTVNTLPGWGNTNNVDAE